MKQTLLIFTLALLFLSCNQNKEKAEISQTGRFYPEVKQRSLIIGQITNINEFSDAPRAIKLSVDDITINHQHSFETEIDDSGKFVFDIPLYHSINSYLNYGDARITPYLFPNDTIYLNCKIGKKGFKIGIVSGEFDEKHDKFETQFFKQHQWIHYKQINKFRDKLSKDLTLEELKKQYLDFENVLLEKIEKRVDKDSLNDLLSDYLRYSAKYSIYRDIIRLGKKIEDKDEKQQFFSFITDSIAFNERAMVTSDYRLFLNSYRFNVEARPNINFFSAGKTKKEAKKLFISECINENLKLRFGVWSKFLGASKLYSMFTREKEITHSLISTYSEIIMNKFNEPYVSQLLLAICNKTSKKVEKVSNQTIPNDAKLSQYDSISGEELFDKLLEKNNGKVVYIDIWATWCSPCKQQIPHSQRMHEMLKGEDVSFIYLCCRSGKDIWENVIKQYQIIGNHILLNDKQYEFLKTKFSISGIPRYILIDKRGNIINSDAPRPDSEQIISDIKKLIEE